MPVTEPKRVLLLGAETELGQACAEALAEAGARLTLVSSKPDVSSAFAVQRLARKLGASAQAIDATNEAAVRVMLRQVSKDLGGLDATVVCVADSAALSHTERLARREMARSGDGVFVVAADSRGVVDVVAAVAASPANG